MANIKISQMVAATLPLAGTELLEVVQGGSNKKATIDQLKASVLKPAPSIPLTDDITINSCDNANDLFVVPAAQATPIVVNLLAAAADCSFAFTTLNKSDKAVTFSDGTNPITDVYGFGTVTQGGLVTCLWDGEGWSISGGLD